MNNSAYRFTLATVCAIPLLIAGCGGSSGGGGGQPAGDVSATGLWEGTFTEDGVGTADLLGLISGEEAIFISFDADVMYEGQLAVDGDNLSGAMSAFEISGPTQFTTNISATVRAQESIIGTFASSLGGQGSIALGYDPITERGSSLATTDANWTLTDGGSALMSISIDSTGSLTGSDSTGCAFNGDVGIIDADVNIYSVDLDIFSCGADNGAYTGFAVTTDDVSQDDSLIVVVSNDNAIFLVVLDRA